MKQPRPFPVVMVAPETYDDNEVNDGNRTVVWDHALASWHAAAPDFSLTPEHYQAISPISLDEICWREEVPLIVFICNHCPFVKHLLTELVQEWARDLPGNRESDGRHQHNDVTGLPPGTARNE